MQHRAVLTLRSTEDWQSPSFNGRLHRHLMVWEEDKTIVMKLHVLDLPSTVCPGKA